MLRRCLFFAACVLIRVSGNEGTEINLLWGRSEGTSTQGLWVWAGAPLALAGRLQQGRLTFGRRDGKAQGVSPDHR